jgi:GNAT superfamily N-acetyltransferase
MYNNYPFRFYFESIMNGDRILTLRKEGKIVAWNFYSTKQLRFSGMNVRLKAGEAYLYFMYVLEEFRGQGLAEYLRIKTYQKLYDLHHIEKFYSVSEYKNFSALRFKDKLHAKKIGLFIFVFGKLFALKWYDTKDQRWLQGSKQKRQKPR